MTETDVMRDLAAGLFARAVAAADPHAAVRQKISWDDSRSALTIAESTFELLSTQNVYAIAIGKAAPAMASALDEALGNRLAAGLLATPQSPSFPATARTRWRTFIAGHPLPNEESLAAAQAAFALLEQANREKALVVFLISGGGSAAIEWPANDRITLKDLRQANQLLTSCGASIGEINSVRRAFSAVKGGKLAARAPNANKITLIVSDVNRGEESNVASGPTLSVSPNSPDPREVVARYGLATSLPASILEAIRTVKAGSVAEQVADHSSHVLLDNRSLVEAVAREAEHMGLRVEVAPEICEQPIAAGCELLLARLDVLRQKSPADVRTLCLISGGEFSCPVRGDGLGGRNLETVLRCAIQLDKRSSSTSGADHKIDNQPRVAILSAGTDGLDGNSPAAGAIADDTTIARGHALGLDAEAFLRRSDSFSYFNALGDAIITGPTGTNVRDLRIILVGS